MNTRLGLALVAACLLAAGCASNREQSEVSEEDAARFNVQLGVNYLQRGTLQEAREKLERAAQQDPSLPSAHAALGILYERVGELDRAGSHLRRAPPRAPAPAGAASARKGSLTSSARPAMPFTARPRWR